MFGDNYYGQCAIDPKSRNILEKPEMLRMRFKVHNVACGLHHTICIGDRFKIYSWGSNSNGQLGHGDLVSKHTPTEVAALEGTCCLFIACGPNNSMAFDDTGTAYGWGNNSYFRLGISKDSVMTKEQVSSGVNLLKPSKLDFYIEVDSESGVDSLLPDEYMVQVELNSTYSVGITNKDRIFTWGLDFFRAENFLQIMQRNDFKMRFYLKLRHTIPVNEANDKDKDKQEIGKITEVHSGENFSLAKTETGELLIWGSNTQFQHGVETEDIKNFYSDFIKTKKLKRKRTGKIFVNITTLPHFINRFGSAKKVQITSVAVGYKHVIAIERQRAAYSWGNNEYGELGLGNKGRPKILPTRINSMSGRNLTGCAASKDYSMLLTHEGEVFSFGSNKDGKLGLKDKDPKYDVHIPTLIEGSLKLVKAIKIAAGPNHAMALCMKNIEGDDNIFYKLTDEKENLKSRENESGQALLYCWGNGFFGQLGNKKLDNSLVPVQIDISENFKDISCGEKISGAVTNEGKMYLWGCQTSLPRSLRSVPKGTDEVENANVVSSPVLYKSDELKFDSLSLGSNYHCVVGKNSKLYCWGYFTKEGVHCSELTEVKTGNSSQKCDQVSVNKNHALLVFQKTAYSWGLDNFTGRLGHTLEIKETSIHKSMRKRKKKLLMSQKSSMNSNEFYNPEKVLMEPTEVDILNFLIKEKNKELKRKDFEVTAKTSTTRTHQNETQMTSVSGSGFESQLYEQKINLDDKYLFYIYKNAEKAFAKVDREMRSIKEIESKKRRYFEKMKFMIYKRLTEAPFQNIKLRSDNSDQNPKQLSTPEIVRLYNALFTGFQLHPCLLVNLIKDNSRDLEGGSSDAKNLTDENFRDLVVSVFGAMHGDERKEHLYLKVLEKMLEWELIDDINSEDTHFFYMNLLNPPSKDSPKGKKSLPYSSLLIEYLVDNDLRFRLALEQICNFLEEEISEKMKNVERDIRNYVFSFRDENKFFKDRYASDTSNWKEEEFLKRKENLVNLFSVDSSPSIIDMIEFNLSNFIRGMFKTIDKVFKKKFKDFKNRDEVPTLYWGFLINSLAKIVKKRLSCKIKRKKRNPSRFKRNFEDIILFFMHYATSTELPQKEDRKWVTELNEYISDSSSLLSAKMKSAMNSIQTPNLDGELDDVSQRKKIRQLQLYVSRIAKNRPERITVSLLNVVKVCKIVKKQKFSNELYRGFMNQVGEGDESFTSTNPNYFGSERSFNFTILAKEYILDDFISLRSCSSCHCLAPSVFIEPSKAVKIIQSPDFIKKNSDLDIYMKYLGIMEEEKIRAELKGKPKVIDAINQETLTKKIQKEKSTRTQNEYQKIQNMLNMIIERKNEYEINVNEEDDFLCNNTGDSTILEPLFLNLREKTIEQLRRRHQYFRNQTTVERIMSNEVVDRLRDYKKESQVDISPCNEVINGKKKWHLFERIYMNLRLGFSNWKDIDIFEKENKFVKFLRHTIFKQGVSRLIYQNLTKNEKTFITTNFDICDRKELRELIDLGRFKDNFVKQLMVNVSVNEYEDIVMKLLLKKKSYFQILNVFKFTMDDVYALRRKLINSKLKKDVLKKGKNENTNNLKIENNGFSFSNCNKLIEIISKAENLSLIYQQIDYLEDNSTPLI